MFVFLTVLQKQYLVFIKQNLLVNIISKVLWGLGHHSVWDLQTTVVVKYNNTELCLTLSILDRCGLYFLLETNIRILWQISVFYTI